jgi:anaerobic selenocysteine-containing dehydrogenase
MQVSRRNFLQLAGLSTLGAVACNFFPEREFIAQSPSEMPEDLVTGIDNWYATLSPTGTESEGLVIRIMEGRAKKVRGNPLYPINQGSHSVRAEASLQALYHPDRISNPMVRTGNRGDGQYRPIDWNQSLDILRSQLQNLSDGTKLLSITNPLTGSLAHLIKTFSEEFGSRHTSFQPLEETVFNSTVKNLFGQDTLPTFDLKNCAFLLSFGSDFLSTWLSPVQFAKGFGEFRQGTNRTRGTFVQVDSRFSMTAANADQWIPLKPGMEGKLALSMAQVIVSEELVPQTTIESMNTGNTFAELQNALAPFAPESIVSELGIPALNHDKPEDVIRKLARDFASHGSKSIALGGGSSAAHTNGLFNLTAIYALNFLVGSVGQKGGIRFNPKAPVETLTHTSASATTTEWIKIKQAIDNGDISLLLIRNANPLHGLLNDIGIGDSLRRDDIYIVAFSTLWDETTEIADLVLPEKQFLEDWGDDVPKIGPGFQLIGMQQPVVKPIEPLNPMAFSDVILRMANELGIASSFPLNKTTFLEVLKDNAASLHQLGRGSITEPSFDKFWNKYLQQGGWWDEQSTSIDGQPTPPMLMEIVSKHTSPSIIGPTGSNTFNLLPFQSLALTDGTGAHLPWLQSTPDPITSVVWSTWVEINTKVAEEMGLKEGDFVTIEGSNGNSLEARIYHHPAVPPNTVSIPIGQGHTSSIKYSKDRGANPLEIIGLPIVDHIGSLAWASTRIKLTATGKSSPVPKFEGIVLAEATSEHEAVIKITRG